MTHAVWLVLLFVWYITLIGAVHDFMHDSGWRVLRWWALLLLTLSALLWLAWPT